MRRTVVPAILLLLLVGCLPFVPLPHRKPAPDTDYGLPPQNYEKLIKDHVKVSWWGEQGYHSPQRFGRLRKAYVNRGLIYGGGVDWVGYVVPFYLMDSKGRGWKVFAFIHNDKVDDVGQHSNIHYVD